MPTTHKGFTLVELVLSIAIVGVLAAVVGPILIGAVKSYALVTNRQATLNSTRLAIERMSSEMKLIPSANSIDIFQASTFQFDTPSENDINYTLSSGNLLRSGAVLVSNVTSLSFAYLDANGAPTATKANIKRISVEMTINAGSGFGTLQLRTQVFPRRFAAYYANFQ